MAGRKRRKYEVDETFYEKLMKAAYEGIEDQTGVVLSVLEKHLADGRERASCWSDIQNYIVRREGYRIGHEIIKLIEESYRGREKLWEAIDKKRMEVLQDCGLGNVHEGESGFGEAALKRIAFDKGLLVSVDEAVTATRMELQNRLAVLIDDVVNRHSVWEEIEKLAVLREGYRTNQEILEFSGFEMGLGKKLIDAVMMKRLRVAVEYGVLGEEGTTG